MATPALSVRSLSKRYELYDRPVDRLRQTLWRGRRKFYREFWALRDVGFTLAPGQALGVVGRNGSGKSTLLQLVAGTLAPTAGEIDCTGRVAALLELGSGFNPEFSGRENVLLNGAILGLRNREMRARMAEVLAFADIGEFVDRPVKTYSSGMALRLAFAVATAVSPRILIVDEALAVGDEAFQRKCIARIEQMREGGTAVLFVSHSPMQILELCDAALLLDAGEMLLLDEPRRVVPEYQRLLYAAPEAAGRLRDRLRAARRAQNESVPHVQGESAQLANAEAASLAHAEAASRARAGSAAARTEPPSDVAVATAEPGASRAPETSPPAAAYDPDLRSTSTVEFPERGARIHAPRITTPDGEPVNVLVRGGAYEYVYDVEFLRPARHVEFGMMIKTTSGLELGGGTHGASAGAEASFPAGARVRVRFEFRCRLFAGMYFVNAGVAGEADGAHTYLHRLVDAVAFRVQPDPGCRPSGYVDFEVRSSIAPAASGDGKH